MLKQNQTKTKPNSPGFLLTSKLLNWPQILFYQLQKRNSGDSSAGMNQDKRHFTAVEVRIFWEKEMFLIPSSSFHKFSTSWLKIILTDKAGQTFQSNRVQLCTHCLKTILYSLLGKIAGMEGKKLFRLKRRNLYSDPFVLLC